MPVLLLQHHDVESAGKIGTTLRNCGRLVETHRPDRHGSVAIPSNLRDFEGLVIMGGPQDLDDAGLKEHRWLSDEIALIRAAHAAQLPILGVCLGAQLIAHALGGKLRRMPSPEVGFADLRINPAGQVEPLLSGIPWKSPQYHVHAFEISELPDGAKSLASSDACANQAFKVGLRTYAFQYHFECNRMMIDDFHEQAHDMFDRGGVAPDQLSQQADQHMHMYDRVGDRHCRNVATMLFHPMSVTA